MKQQDLDDLRLIEAIRSKNNINWMEILRIALDRDPDATKAVLKRIKKNDHDVSTLTEHIASR